MKLALLILVLGAASVSVHAQTPEDELARLQKERSKFEMEEKTLRTALKKSAGKEAEKLELELAETRQIRDALTERIATIEEPVDMTKGVSDVCPAHRVKMTAREVPIAYGLLWPMVPPATRQREFPYARAFLPGGCMTSGGDPIKARIYICPACQGAEKKWLATHKTK